MALKLTVRMGGGTAATTVNYTSQLRVWDVSEGGVAPIFDAGMMYQNGAASQFQFVLSDDDNEIPKADLTKNLPAHTVVTVSEDAPGFEAWLTRGRIADKEAYRADLEMGNAIGWSVTADDANVDVRGLALTSAWTRSAESGRARILALITAFLTGSPRPSTTISNHLVASGGEVTMPAKTYPAGTELTEIIEDCATTEGKVWGVVIHHLSSASHLCFQYIDEADHTTYLSTLSITDTSPNLTTSFPPMWDQGAAKIEDGQELATGVVSRYGADDDSFVFVEDTADVTSYDYWVVPYNDSLSETAAQATARADSIREAKSREHVTHQVTIQLRANQVDLLCAGMSIPIRAAASMGGQYLGTSQTRRIAQLKWEPIAPEVGAVDGYYLAHMQLDRPVRLLAAGPGLPVGPKPAGGNPEALTCANASSVGTATSKWANGTLETNDTNWYDYSPGGGRSSTHARTGTWSFRVSSHGSYMFENQTFEAGKTYAFKFWQYTLDDTTGFGSPPHNVRIGKSTNGTSHWTKTSHYTDDVYGEWEVAPGEIEQWLERCVLWTPTQTWTDDVRIEFHLSGGSWVDDAVVYEGAVAAAPQPNVEGGDVGDDVDHYAHADHQHPLQPASDTPYDPSESGLEASNVQDAIDELASGTTTLRQTITATVLPIIAHRGDINADDGYPENTTEAMVQAARRGAHGIEFDCLRSSDGTWHVIHDTTVDRTTNGTGTVASKTDAQLAALGIDGGYGYDSGRHGTSLTVPTLDAMLDAVEAYDLILWFDLKETTDAAHTALATYIVDNGHRERAILICRSTSGATAVKAVNPEIETAVLSDLLTDVENYDDIDRLLAEPEHIVGGAAFVDARQPKPVDHYREVTIHHGTPGRAYLIEAWNSGVRMHLTSSLRAALSVRHDLINNVQAGGRWEPVYFGGAQVLFNGDPVMFFVRS